MKSEGNSDRITGVEILLRRNKNGKRIKEKEYGRK
jgi:hypothetical protein